MIIKNLKWIKEFNSKNRENITLLDMLERNSINWELLASSNDTEFIINQSIKGINNPDEIFIVNHFLVALIILN